MVGCQNLLLVLLLPCTVHVNGRCSIAARSRDSMKKASLTTLLHPSMSESSSRPDRGKGKRDRDDEEIEEEEAAAAESSSSRGGEEEEDGRWLQLGIGEASTSYVRPPPRDRVVDRSPAPELDLFSFPNRGPSMSPPAATTIPPSSSAFLRYGLSSQRMQEIGAGGPRRMVISRRSAAGVWFVLQAADNQMVEPFLPEMPKRYLRIKDGGMTVRFVMKYLVNKLVELQNESEVEILCRGQRLSPSMTLEHVRDAIWCTREPTAASRPVHDPTASPSSIPEQQVMVLLYRRSM